MEEKKPIIQFKKVNKTFTDNTSGLDDVSFEIMPGEFVFLIGSSGAGKTTLMRHIVREDLPTSGDITVDGIDLLKVKSKDVPFLRRKVGFIYQDFKLLDSKTVFENVALSLYVVNKSDEEIETIVPNLLHLVGLGGKENRFPKNLSGGEKQRLAIARALAHEPKIILADEPTGNLDRTSTWVIVDLIKKINEWGTTIIFGTHEGEIVDALRKRVIHLEHGKIIKDQEKGTYY
jgi:cell division transport system ATP-binding protein